MDFLEGFLMGPIWSDTEYETRRHIGFHLFLGFMLSSLLIWFAIKPEQAGRWLDWPLPLLIIVVILMVLVTPFICSIYYRLHVLLKLLVLAFLVFKFVIALVAAYQLILPHVNLDLIIVPDRLMTYVNDTIAKATAYYAEMSKATGMLLGIVTGGLLLVLRVGLLVVAMLLAPVLLLQALKLVQRAIDWLVARYVLRNFD